MPFRENDEATRARAEALAEEVEELKKERDDLLEEKKAHFEHPEPPEEPEEPEPIAEVASPPNEQSQKPDPTPPPEDAPTRPSPPSFVSEYATVIAAVAFFIGVVIFIGVRESDKSNAAVTPTSFALPKVATPTDLGKEWDALVVVESCVRQAERANDSVREIAARELKSTTAGNVPPIVIYEVMSPCGYGRKDLIAFDQTNPEVKAALSQWDAAEEALRPITSKLSLYYKNEDYKDDHYASGPEQWTAYLAALDARAKSLVAVRTIVFPALRSRIHERIGARGTSAKHVELWWRVDIGLAIWDIDEIAFRESGISAGKKPDLEKARGAVHGDLEELAEHVKGAPVEVRRDLRKYDLDALASKDAGAAMARGDGGAPSDFMKLIFDQDDPMSNLKSRNP